MQKKPIKILILFYSFSGNVATLAREIAAGAQGVADTEVILRQVPELLPANFFDSKPGLKALRSQLDAEFPIATMDDFVNADGIAFGTPTHFGSFASQIKQFIDSVSPSWVEGKLVGKPAALFCTAGSIHGGEEVALLSLMIPLLNLGMIPVGIPYPIQGVGQEFDAGSPYGAIYVTGHSANPIALSEADKKVARILGLRLATTAHKLNCACDNCTGHHDLTQKIA